MLYTEQKLVSEEVDMLYIKHLEKIIKDFDSLERKQIKQSLIDLYDLVTRYS